MANLVFDFLHNYHAGERRDSEPANAYQYDEGHVIEANIPDAITSCEIHYWIRGMEEAEAYTPTSITVNQDGTRTILGHVPNEYFRTNGELRVYIVVTDGDASLTTYEGRIQICQRSIPDDYVDDDPENPATRVIIEAQAAAETATEAAQTAQNVADSIPADYTQMSADVDTLKTDVTDLKEDLSSVENNILTDDIRQALLQIASKVAYIDEDGQDYYDALNSALYPPSDLVSISAVYTQSGTVYDTDTLDSLKSDLVVTALYDDQTTETVTTYALSGTLTVGTSTITVSYGGKTTTFTVTVTEYRGIPENYTWLYDARSGELLSEQEYVSKTTSGGTTSETIIDDFLRIHADNNGTTSGSSSVLLTFQFSDTTTTNGVLTTRLKPIDLANDDGAGGVGLQLQLSNGSSGSQVWVEENKENAGHILISYYTGGTRNKVSTSFLVDEYHVFEVSLQNGKQALSIDGTQVYESSTLSTNYTSVNRVRLQGVGSSRCPNGVTADIDWLTYYEVS